MIKQTRRELRKISEGVFDKATLMSIYNVSRKGLLDELEGIISTGKEANVYFGRVGEGKVAVKIYLVETSDFKTMEKYILHDRRFSSWRNRRQLIYTWAMKEFRNLSILHGKIRCPKPLGVKNNVLVMELIGDCNTPAPRLKESMPDDPVLFFEKIKQYMRNMYKEGIVHGDLSEYNILNWEGPVIIDLSMGVLLDHPLAEELLRRDVRNIVKYFGKLGVKEDDESVIDFIKSS